MTEALFTTLAILWTFGCCFTYITTLSLPHRCRWGTGCPHRKDIE